MGRQDAGYDYNRYRELLADATDETRRLELIDLMIKEKARDRLEAQRTSDRVAMTAETVARILGPLPGRHDSLKFD
jgi:hypothetical protein